MICRTAALQWRVTEKKERKKKKKKKKKEKNQHKWECSEKMFQEEPLNFYDIRPIIMFATSVLLEGSFVY